jgi:hypothetical protein
MRKKTKKRIPLQQQSPQQSADDRPQRPLAGLLQTVTRTPLQLGEHARGLVCGVNVILFMMKK